MKAVIDQAPAGRHRETRPTAHRALAALALPVLLASLGTSSVNVALPELAGAFGASFQALQWIVIAYLLASTTLIVSVGRLGDSVGRRRLLLAGILLFSLASVLGGLASELWLLLAARALQGLGAAAMLALTMALVGTTVAPARTGRAIGLLGTMSALGTALGPALGGVLIAGAGWRAIFLINLPLGLLAWLLARRQLADDRRETADAGAGFDFRGTLLLALTLAAYALAMTSGGGRFGLPNLLLLLLAGLGAAGFVAVAARTPAPLIGLATLRDRELRASLGSSLLVATVMMATLVVGPFYLAGALGLGVLPVGIVMSVGPGAAALAALPAGRLADRFGARRIIRLGLLAMAGSAVALALLPPESGLAGYLLPLVVLTTGYALFQTANNTAVMTAIDAAQRGAVAGLLNLSRNLGLITGAALMGSVFSLAAATAAIDTAPPAALAVGMRTTFAVAAALVVLALAIASTALTGRQER